MTITSNTKIIILRVIYLIIISLSLYNYNVNNGFFGVLIIVFLLYFLFRGANRITIDEDQISFKHKRLVPIWERLNIIKCQKIKSIDFIEGKINSATITQYIIAILIHKWFYAPVDHPEDELVIEYKTGEIYRHERIGTKKKFKEAVSLLEKKHNHSDKIIFLFISTEAVFILTK